MNKLTIGLHATWTSVILIGCVLPDYGSGTAETNAKGTAGNGSIHSAGATFTVRELLLALGGETASSQEQGGRFADSPGAGNGAEWPTATNGGTDPLPITGGGASGAGNWSHPEGGIEATGASTAAPGTRDWLTAGGASRAFGGTSGAGGEVNTGGRSHTATASAGRPGASGGATNSSAPAATGGIAASGRSTNQTLAWSGGTTNTIPPGTNPSPSGGAMELGGAGGNGGAGGSGGAPENGGSISSGGSEASGGSLGSGGSEASGGSLGSGGSEASGGSLGSGGSTACTEPTTGGTGGWPACGATGVSDTCVRGAYKALPRMLSTDPSQADFLWQRPARSLIGYKLVLNPSKEKVSAMGAIAGLSTELVPAKFRIAIYTSNPDPTPHPETRVVMTGEITVGTGDACLNNLLATASFDPAVSLRSGVSVYWIFMLVGNAPVAVATANVDVPDPPALCSSDGDSVTDWPETMPTLGPCPKPSGDGHINQTPRLFSVMKL